MTCCRDKGIWMLSIVLKIQSAQILWFLTTISDLKWASPAQNQASQNFSVSFRGPQGPIHNKGNWNLLELGRGLGVSVHLWPGARVPVVPLLHDLTGGKEGYPSYWLSDILWWGKGGQHRAALTRTFRPRAGGREQVYSCWPQNEVSWVWTCLDPTFAPSLLLPDP